MKRQSRNVGKRRSNQANVLKILWGAVSKEKKLYGAVPRKGNVRFSNGRPRWPVHPWTTLTTRFRKIILDGFKFDDGLQFGVVSS